MDFFEQEKGNKSLTSIIFEKIREDILNGKYKSNEKIIEGKLAEELGVSRTPVREALKQLELDTLVENIPNRGVFVKGLTVRDIEDIYTIRDAIESIAVRWSIERMNKKDLENLNQVYELMEFYVFKKNLDKVFELHTKFHEIIYKATKSRFLEQVLKDFQLFIKSHRYLSLKSEGRMNDMLEEHRGILEAFVEGKAEKAIEQIVKHSSALKRTIEEGIE